MFGFATPAFILARRLINNGYYFIETTQNSRFNYLFSAAPFKKGEYVFSTAIAINKKGQKQKYYIIAEVKDCKPFTKEIYKQLQPSSYDIESRSQTVKYDDRLQFFRIYVKSHPYFINKRIYCYLDSKEQLDYSSFRYAFGIEQDFSSYGLAGDVYPNENNSVTPVEFKKMLSEKIGCINTKEMYRLTVSKQAIPKRSVYSNQPRIRYFHPECTVVEAVIAGEHKIREYIDEKRCAVEGITGFVNTPNGKKEARVIKVKHRKANSFYTLEEYEKLGYIDIDEEKAMYLSLDQMEAERQSEHSMHGDLSDLLDQDGEFINPMDEITYFGYPDKDPDDY